LYVVQVGNGPRSSALVGGFTAAHRQLELTLAKLKGTEDALLFPTGFAANTAVVSVLGTAAASSTSSSSSLQQQLQQQQQQQEGPDVVIFSDELNHASIIDGARLATRGPGTVLQVYRHNDMRHLEQLLLAAPVAARKLVVTDSLFSMDGDYADLKVCRSFGRGGGVLEGSGAAWSRCKSASLGH
jgi:8-amino-7-oxononanoate synthase